MKRVPLALLIILSTVVFGCSSKDKVTSASIQPSASTAPTSAVATPSPTVASKSLSLNDYIEAYKKLGVTVDPNEQPLFQIINAKAGVIFYMDNNKVAIYEYASEADLDKAISDNESIKAWPRSGNFLLETSNSKATETFKSVK